MVMFLISIMFDTDNNYSHASSDYDLTKILTDRVALSARAST